LLTCSSQPLSAWCAQRKYRGREKCDGRTDGRNQCNARISLVANGLVLWLRDRVRHLTYDDALSSLISQFFSPLIGGTLSRPQDRWPRLFSHPFWAKYPYSLPCLVAAVYCCILWVITAMFLKEVRPPYFEERRRKT